VPIHALEFVPGPGDVIGGDTLPPLTRAGVHSELLDRVRSASSAAPRFPHASRPPVALSAVLDDDPVLRREYPVPLPCDEADNQISDPCRRQHQSGARYSLDLVAHPRLVEDLIVGVIVGRNHRTERIVAVTAIWDMLLTASERVSKVLRL
jgi:hypothetical protein